jgi:hypothetical protein
MKKPLTKKFLIILLSVCAIFGTCKFEYDSRSSNFVPVKSITGVPTGGVKGYEFTLSRSVEPETATNKTIVWSIEEDGGTDAVLDRNKLTATSTGTVTVKAVIKDGKAPGVDYTQEFEITIFDEYIAVNSIQDIPSRISTGSVTLKGTVKPSDAVNKTIKWELKPGGETGATLVGDQLTTTAFGKLTVTAVVEKGAGPDTDFRQDFEITVSFIPVTSITGVASGCVMGNYTLFGIVSPRNATFKNITWQINDARSTGAVIKNGNELATTSTGTVRVAAIVKDGIDFGYDFIQDFNIKIDNYHYGTTSIVGLPTGCRVGDYTLGGVIPNQYMTNITIIWEVADAGETGAVIDGNVLTTTAPGTVTITAIVKDGTAPGVDYRQEFSMEITE